MNLILVVIVILSDLVKGDSRNWEKYYPTMLYTALATFLYEFISHSHYHLWELRKDSMFNLMNIHFVHNLIINPLIALVYLSNFPSKRRQQIIYILKWILIFLLIEWVGNQFGMLTYHNGWHFGWSALFVVIMFPMVRLHHVHKLWALLLSVLCALFYLIWFDYI
ncbi:CBO0543 family protein [Bacillus gobiensis]|uniref:CBO0543 family protein n=1 Tax=Bacillus gobiensis TaxID=1441095 RepID=UPI003D1FF890